MRLKSGLVALVGVVVLAVVAVWLVIGSRTVAPVPTATDTAAAGLAGPSATVATSAVAPAIDARATADKVLAVLQAHDGPALAALVHPDGVRMSPSAFVDFDSDQLLSASDVAVLWTKSGRRVWGSAEASGDAIELTSAAYVDRYIIDHDYRGAVVSMNRDSERGTTVDNAAMVYPGSTRIEYFRQGAEASDWSALRLVMVPVDSEWRLVGIIHDEWTP